MDNEFPKILQKKDERPEAIALLQNIKAHLAELEALLEKTNGHWGMEDKIYRFYHQSLKVFGIQDYTDKLVKALQDLHPAPERGFHEMFARILAEGTGKEFSMSDNDHWVESTRSLLEAFFHARYFLEMVIKYGNEFKDHDAPPNLLPSGWASVLYLYRMR